MSDKQNADSNKDGAEPVLFIRGLSREEKCRFKSWCAARDTTMTQKIIEWVRETITRRRRAVGE